MSHVGTSTVKMLNFRTRPFGFLKANGTFSKEPFASAQLVFIRVKGGEGTVVMDPKINDGGSNRVFHSVWSVPFVDQAGLVQTRFKVIYLLFKKRGNLTVMEIHPTSISVKEVR